MASKVILNIHNFTYVDFCWLCDFNVTSWPKKNILMYDQYERKDSVRSSPSYYERAIHSAF